MIYNQRSSGFILMLAMASVAIVATIITTITSKTFLYRSYMRTVVAREQARQLALSGVQIAISQLAYPQPLVKEQKSEKEKPDPQLLLLQQLVPTINRWQQYALKEAVDGIDGDIKVCITCEQGKINLNALYDFEKHQFVGDTKQQESTKKLLKSLFERLEKVTKGKNMFTGLETFLKNKKYSLNDATELISIPEFIVFKNKLFYEPPMQEKGSTTERSVYLTDVFTSWSEVGTFEPWLLSDSLCELLDLKRAAYNDKDQRERILREKIKDMKVKASWSQDWNKLLASLYGKNSDKLLPEMLTQFKDTFGPQQFFVISYGTVNNVTDRVGAVLELNPPAQGDKSSLPVTLKRLYWL